MRVLLAFLIGLVTAAFVAAAIILVVQNGQGERLTFLGLSFSGYVGWDLAAAAGLGFILAFLLLVPGRLASAWRSVGLGKQTRQLEERLATLRQEYARLEGEHGVLRDEHEQLRIVAASQPLTVTIAAPPALPPAATPVVVDEAPRPLRLIGVPQPAAEPASPMPAPVAAEAKPRFFERVRARFRRERLAGSGATRTKDGEPPALSA